MFTQFPAYNLTRGTQHATQGECAHFPEERDVEEFVCEATVGAAPGDNVVEERVEVRVGFGEFDDAVNHPEVQPQTRQAAQGAAMTVIGSVML